MNEMDICQVMGVLDEKIEQFPGTGLQKMQQAGVGKIIIVSIPGQVPRIRISNLPGPMQAIAEVQPAICVPQDPPKGTSVPLADDNGEVRIPPVEVCTYRFPVGTE